MRLIPLTSEYKIGEFDCGDEDLNEFLLYDAISCMKLNIANTFILEDDGRIVAYFCLLNDKISRTEITGSRWKKIKARFPKSKQFRCYPCVKIGRFAVSIAYRGKNIGSKLMDLLKDSLIKSNSFSAFRYITVDAYISAIPFYEKNGFAQLNEKDENEHTRLMFFDKMDI